jgi:hypothetical protein
MMGKGSGDANFAALKQLEEVPANRGFLDRSSLLVTNKDLLADHRYLSRGIRPDLDLTALHFEDGDDDVVGDAEGFADTAGEDQHGAAPLRC